MTFQCPNCGYLDNPIWKPLFWKLYGSYADLEDFKREYPHIKFENKIAEDRYFDYELRGKTRKMVHRFPKAFRMMRKRKLYEKTPSEKRKVKYAKL